MPEYLTPGVYFELVDAPPAVRGLRTDIAGFVGLAERGPLDEPTQIESWRQFQAHFGGFVPYGFLAYAVKGFFENGGQTCFVTRVAGADAAAASLTLRNGAGIEVIRIVAKSEGRWGDRIAVTLQARPAAARFSLRVTHGAAEPEIFRDLSTDPEDLETYFATVINEGSRRTAASAWVTAEVFDGLPPATSLMPDAAASGLKRGTGFLSGGRDGVASLKRDDFIGDFDPLASKKKGLSSFDRVDAVAIVCVPDIHILPAPPPPVIPPPDEPPRDPCLPRCEPPETATPGGDTTTEQPPAFTLEEVAEVQRAMIEHCELHKDRVAVLEVPASRQGGGPLIIEEVRAWRSRFDSERGFAALYHPWVKVVDPLRLGGRPTRAVPPSGHIAGLYARTDVAVGVHKAPANGELFWAEDVTADIGDEVQGVLNPEGVNCLRTFPGRGLRVYGARTVSGNPDWRYVNVRRLMLMIEEAVDEATQWSVFEPHNFALRQTLAVGVSHFLETIWRQGGLAGASPEEAYYVKCDDQTNPPETVNEGRLIAEVGVAPTRPAEFIVFRVGRTLEELEKIER